MNKEETFAIWSPDDSPWSRWAKPVLFAFLDLPLSGPPITEDVSDVTWAPAPQGKVALVLDLPGADGVILGLALARHGYRPVPLYNTVPLPFHEPPVDPLTGRTVAAVDVLPILNALRKSAERLAELRIPRDAPPVFLLDADRRGGGRIMQAKEFDNRSICFTTDFPSANFLATHGIQRVLLIQKQD